VGCQDLQSIWCFVGLAAWAVLLLLGIQGASGNTLGNLVICVHALQGELVRGAAQAAANLPRLKGGEEGCLSE